MMSFVVSIPRSDSSSRERDFFVFPGIEVKLLASDKVWIRNKQKSPFWVTKSSQGEQNY